MTQQPAPRVFISYSHDSEKHAARVLKLANDLRQHGVNAIIDQYLTSPPDGWPAWMDAHVRDDNFVIMVCTETYYRRVVRKEAPGIGLGVAWEGSLIYNHLYKARGDLSRFVPVLLNGGKPDHIPEPVFGGTHYLVETPAGYKGLLRRLFDWPVAALPALGNRPALPQIQAEWTTRPLGALHNVPELPPHFIPRPNLLSDLKEKLLAGNGGAIGVTGVATKIGVQGMGGIGKSVLTAAVVRDDEVSTAFPAGIFWITLGQTPAVLNRQADLYWLLTHEKGGFADAQQGRIALQEALRSRSCLVVLDDVWRLADAEAFNVVDADARLLLTTRDAAILKGIGAAPHEVDRLDRSAALRLLAQTSGIAEESLPAEAHAIAEECDGLPLALALAGGMIESQADMWSLVLEALRTADWEQINRDFAGYPYPHVFAAIEASVNALGTDRERYLDLAIFPEDVPVPEAALKMLWADIKPLQVRKLVTRFRDRSLASLNADDHLALHDLQRDFVRARARDLPARQERLVEAYRSQWPNGWAKGPDDGYFFRHLPLHLAQAGCHDELTALLADHAWIEAKLKAADVQSVISDYDLIANEPDLSLVQRALRLSIPALSRDWTYLSSQLIGRLRSFEEPRIQALLEKANAGPGTAWLCPQTASLMPPGPLLQTFAGHRGGVTALAALPDGRALSGSFDGTLRLWDLASGESRVLEGHTNTVMALAVLPDGRALSGSLDETLRLWDLARGESRVLTRNAGWVEVLAALPDGRALSSSRNEILQLWDLTIGDSSVLKSHTGWILSHLLKGHTGWILALAVLPDGRALSGSDDNTLRLWDLTSGESRVLGRHTGWVKAVAVLPNDRAISGSADDGLRLWDLASGASPVLEGHTGRVIALAALPDGRALSASEDETLRLWDLASGESRVLKGHAGIVRELAVLPDGRALSGSNDSTLRLWNLTSGASHVLEGHEGYISALAVLPDGRALSGSNDGTLRLWDLTSGASHVLKNHAEHRLKGGLEFITALAALPDGRVLSRSFDGTLRLWDLTSGESRVLEGSTADVGALARSPLAVLPDGRALSGSDDNTLRLWDLASGESRVLTGHTAGVRTLAVFSDGRTLSGSWDGTVRLWDLASGESRVLTGHTAGVKALAVLPDGRALSGSSDWSVIVWDLARGTPMAAFVGDAAICCVAATPTHCLAGAENGAVHVLRLCP